MVLAYAGSTQKGLTRDRINANERKVTGWDRIAELGSVIAGSPYMHMNSSIRAVERERERALFFGSAS